MKVQLSIFCVLLLSLSVRAQGNVCQGLFFGIVADPDRCDRYFLCILTIPRAVNCPENNVFDPSQRECVPGDQETCEIFGNESTTTRTTGSLPITTTPGTPSPDLDAICEGIFFGARPYPESIEHFVGCIRDKGVLFKCDHGEYFQPLINECVDWDVPDTTTGSQDTSSVPSSIPITDSTIMTTPESTPRPNACIGRDMEFIEHPEFCYLYIFCSRERENILLCPDNTIYDVTINDCRYGDRDTCQFLDENSVPTTETFAPCEGIQNGVVADGDSCTRYYRCFMGSHVPQSCNPGQIFSQDRMMCVNGNAETCTADDA